MLRVPLRLRLKSMGTLRLKGIWIALLFPIATGANTRLTGIVMGLLELSLYVIGKLNVLYSSGGLGTGRGGSPQTSGTPGGGTTWMLSICTLEYADLFNVPRGYSPLGADRLGWPRPITENAIASWSTLAPPIGPNDENCCGFPVVFGSASPFKRNPV